MTFHHIQGNAQAEPGAFPGFLGGKKGSKIWLLASGAIPHPVSDIAT
jgi:hypothetical protein